MAQIILLANYAIGLKESGGAFNMQNMRESLNEAYTMQTYTDGGFDGEDGAFAVQVVVYTREGQVTHRETIGYIYRYITGALSAFQMEMLGLDTATELIVPQTKEARLGWGSYFPSIELPLYIRICCRGLLA